MDNSPLARLPPEIRNAIYTATFASRYAVKLGPSKITHPLTWTCRQLRREALPVYLSLTVFNAHLDDGPATPVARWLQALGAQQSLLIGRINMWDLHILNGSLHGTAAAARMMRDGPESLDDVGREMILRPVGRQVFHRGWYLKAVIVALHGMGLGLARFCVILPWHRIKETSHYAIVPLPGMEEVLSETSTAEVLTEQFGLREAEQSSLVEQLEQGIREVTLSEGRWNITMGFDDSRRLSSLSREYIPRRRVVLSAPE